MAPEPTFYCSMCGAPAKPAEGARRLKLGQRVMIFCPQHAGVVRELALTTVTHGAQSAMRALERRHPIFGAVANALGQAALPQLLGDDHE